MDLVHLARQTNGDRRLESEVLALMQRHLVQLLEGPARMERGATRTLAHAIGGAARNVGAFPLAAAADALQDGAGDAEAVARFRREAERTLVFIAALAERRGALTAAAGPTTCAA